MMLVHEGLPEGEMLHGNIWCSFTRDCQRGKCCTVKYDACSRGIAREGKCCTVTYDAVHEGLPERGKCCTVTYDAIHDGLPERGNVTR